MHQVILETTGTYMLFQSKGILIITLIQKVEVKQVWLSPQKAFNVGLWVCRFQSYMLTFFFCRIILYHPITNDPLIFSDVCCFCVNIQNGTDDKSCSHQLSDFRSSVSFSFHHHHRHQLVHWPTDVSPVSLPPKIEAEDWELLLCVSCICVTDW